MSTAQSPLGSLFRDLTGDDGKAINTSVATFGDLTDPNDREQAFHRLTVLLHDPNPWFRLRAVFALHHLSDRRAIDLFLDTLDDVPDDGDITYEIFEAKFDALTSKQLLNKRSIVPLINRLDRVDFKTAWSLYVFGSEVIKPLCDALSHDSQSVRWQAAYLLGNLRDAHAIKPLREALAQDDNHVRVTSQIITSLKWLGTT